jgi:hypothetical protein
MILYPPPLEERALLPQSVVMRTPMAIRNTAKIAKNMIE